MPVLPFLFDHPVEKVTDTVFDWIAAKLIERDNAIAAEGKKEL